MPHTGAFIGDALGLRCGSFDLERGVRGFRLRVGRRRVAAARRLRARAHRGRGDVEPHHRSRRPRHRHPVRRRCRRGGARAHRRARRASSAWDLGCDGSAAGLIEIPAGGGRPPASTETVAARGHYMKMQGQEVFRRAVRAVVDSSTDHARTARASRSTTSRGSSPTRRTCGSSRRPPSVSASARNAPSRTSSATATRRRRRSRSRCSRRSRTAACTTAISYSAREWAPASRGAARSSAGGSDQPRREASRGGKLRPNVSRSSPARRGASAERSRSRSPRAGHPVGFCYGSDADGALETQTRRRGRGRRRPIAVQSRRRRPRRGRRRVRRGRSRVRPGHDPREQCGDHARRPRRAHVGRAVARRDRHEPHRRVQHDPPGDAGHDARALRPHRQRRVRSRTERPSRPGQLRRRESRPIGPLAKHRPRARIHGTSPATWSRPGLS